MSRYYFDLHNGDGPLKDEEGLELETRESVNRQVARILADLARDEMPTHDRAVISLKVRNEAGQVVSFASLTFQSEWVD